MPVRVNMATSLDGRIAPADRRKVRLGTDEDILRLEALREWADVIVLGAGTVRAEDPPMELKDPEAVRRRERAGRPAHPAVAVLTRLPDLKEGRVFRTPGRCLVVTVEEAPEPPPGSAAAEGSAELWRVGRGRVDLPALVARLADEEMPNVLVEGGGGLAAGFFGAGLVDELFLTITAWLLGGETGPTLADAPEPFPQPPEFELVELEARPDELFLTYRRKIAGPTY